MLPLRSTSEGPKDDVDWSGITDLAEVGGACTIPGFSEAVQEKEVKGWRSALGLRCRLRSERIRCSMQKALSCGYYWFLHFF